MTRKIQKRDNDYYLERLRSDHPAVYADLQAGKFRNPAEAFVAAGLRRQKSALDMLRTAWTKASGPERDAFRVLIGCAAPPASAPATMPLPASTSPPSSAGRGTVSNTASLSTIHANRYLTPVAKAAIEDVMARRGITTGIVMREMGFKPLNGSLGMALSRNTQLRPEMIAALEKWLAVNAIGSGS